MKKIANSIMLVSILPMIVIMTLFSFISYRFTRDRIIEMTDSLINSSTSSWKT